MLLAYRRHIVIGLQVAVAFIGGVGLLLFLFALGPTHISITPGSIVRYRVSGDVRSGAEALSGEFTEASSRNLAGDCWLWALSSGYAMLQAPINGGQQAPTMHAVDYSPLGRLQRRDSRGHLREDGMSLHYFDLNLMPLPPGGEQHWQVTVYWNALPPGRRAVRCQVQRLTNTMNPRFRLQPIAPIQWVIEKPQPAFAQVRDLTVDYTYDTSLGGITDAVMRFSFLRETEGTDFARHDFSLTIHGSLVPPQVPPATLDALAQRTIKAQHALDRERPTEAQQHLNAIATIPLGHPLLDGLRADLLRTMGTHSGTKQWYLHLASVPSSRRSQAQALVDNLTQQGHPAFMRERDNICQISVGPFNHQDAHTEAALRQHPEVREPYWEHR